MEGLLFHSHHINRNFKNLSMCAVQSPSDLIAGVGTDHTEHYFLLCCSSRLTAAREYGELAPLLQGVLHVLRHLNRYTHLTQVKQLAQQVLVYWCLCTIAVYGISELLYITCILFYEIWRKNWRINHNIANINRILWSILFTLRLFIIIARSSVRVMVIIM